MFSWFIGIYCLDSSIAYIARISWLILRPFTLCGKSVSSDWVITTLTMLQAWLTYMVGWGLDTVFNLKECQFTHFTASVTSVSGSVGLFNTDARCIANWPSWGFKLPLLNGLSCGCLPGLRRVKNEARAHRAMIKSPAAAWCLGHFKHHESAGQSNHCMLDNCISETRHKMIMMVVLRTSQSQLPVHSDTNSS